MRTELIPFTGLDSIREAIKHCAYEVSGTYKFVIHQV